jgi:radical SAM superfamily enzyme YgiQ (UPF0313 family)
MEDVYSGSPWPSIQPLYSQDTDWPWANATFFSPLAYCLDSSPHSINNRDLNYSKDPAMKIGIVSIYSKSKCTLKDMAGGFGTVFDIGNSLRARILEFAKKRMAHVPNIILAYLVSIIENNGVEALVMGNEIIPADLYLIESSIVECEAEKTVGERIKKVTRAQVGYFGTFASAVPEYYLEVADFVIRGEIENIAPQIAQGYMPQGIVDAGLVKDLHDLPFPKWDKFPIDIYRYKIITHRGITLPLLSSRSCPFGCSYCPYMVNSIYRKREAGHVVDEIEFLIKNYHIKGVIFRDPNFCCDRQRVEDIARAILKRNLRIKFYIETRTDLMDIELLKLLHKAGLRGWELGIESASLTIIRGNGRLPPPQAHQEEVIRWCHKLGIKVVANYILGLPNDTAEGIKETIRYAKKLNTFAVQFTMCTPYPGTKFYEQVRDKIFDRNWGHFTGWTNVFHHDHLSTEELHRLKEYAYISYHFRPSYIPRFIKSVFFNGR